MEKASRRYFGFVLFFLLLVVGISFLFDQPRSVDGIATGRAYGDMYSRAISGGTLCPLFESQRECLTHSDCTWKSGVCQSVSSSDEEEVRQAVVAASTLRESPLITLTCPNRVRRRDGYFTCTVSFNSQQNLRFNPSDRFWLTWQFFGVEPNGISSLSSSFNYELIRDGNRKIFSFWPRSNGVIVRPGTTFITLTFPVPSGLEGGAVSVAIGRDSVTLDRQVERSFSFSE